MSDLKDSRSWIESGPDSSSGTQTTPKQSQSHGNGASKHRKGWRRVVRNFSPVWFTVNMGTGMTSILLHNLPYNGQWLQYISYILFSLNVVLFLLFFIISIVRYTLYPEIWSPMIHHPVESLFLGAFPMGAGTIVSMIAFVCVPAWGGNTWLLAWVLWWIVSAVSIFTCWYLPFVTMTVHKNKLEHITAAWLFPIVAPIVSAAAGGIIAEIVPSPQKALITVITSYVLWGTSVPFSMFLLVAYMLRLFTYGIPPPEAVVSSFIPLGPFGLGGFGAMQLGKVALRVFKETNTLPAATGIYAGDIVYVFGFLLALIMWGFRIAWFFFAVSSTVRSMRFSFNMGWWAFTFPIGSFAVSTTMMGKELPSAFFRVLGTIFSVSMVLLWAMVATNTVLHVFKGQLLVSPCVKEMDDKEAATQNESKPEE